MHLLTVGEMARLNHVSEQTLRLYDREGLLCPCVRKENGYSIKSICGRFSHISLSLIPLQQ